MEERDGLLAEYETLRAEILQNDQMIQRMSMFAFWAIVAPLIAFAFKRQMSELLLLPPAAYYVYLQMMSHKLEGTLRIATYIARFIEPAVPGMGWEARIRRLSAGLPGVPTHVLLLLVATVGTVVPSITAAEGPHAYASIVLAALVFAASLFQFRAIKNLAGPQGFAKGWENVAADE